MSRRKHLAVRTSSGNIKRESRLLAPIQVRRLVDLAAADTRHQALGSMLGRIYLAGKVSATEFAAGTRWRQVVANYSVALRSPPPPKTISFDAPGGSPTDPDTESGAQEVKLHEQANRAWIEGRMRCGWQPVGPRKLSTRFAFANVRLAAMPSTPRYVTGCRRFRSCGPASERRVRANATELPSTSLLCPPALAAAQLHAPSAAGRHCRA
jgi:hypothetical protein